MCSESAVLNVSIDAHHSLAVEQSHRTSPSYIYIYTILVCEQSSTQSLYTQLVSHTTLPKKVSRENSLTLDMRYCDH